MSRSSLIASFLLALFTLVGGVWLYLANTKDQMAFASCTYADTFANQLDPWANGKMAAFVPHTGTSRLLPDVVFKDAEGQNVRLSDFRGQKVLLNLWATWCAPCRVEMPEFDELQNRFGGNDFKVLPLSIDTGDDQKPKAFYEEIGLQHLGFYHDGSLAAFQTLRGTGLVVGLPTTILIDEEGCTLGHMSGPAEWASGHAFSLISAALIRER